MFDAAFVINLDRRPERLASFRAQRLPFDVERVKAIDRKDVGEPPSWSAPGGSYACFMSHLKAWKRAKKRGARTVAIFEDDAIIPRDFEHRMQQFLEAVPANWQALHLETEANETPSADGVHRGLIADPINEHVAEARHCIGTVAYVLREPLLTRVLETPHHGHVDRFLQVFQAEGNMYIPTPTIVRHHGGFESDLPPYFRTKP